ncbi:hypothetical protein PF007_g30992, partial [Phytophthora fragariae]
MLPMFSFLLGFIMASSPSPDRKHGLYRQPSRFGCERSRFRSPAGPVFCIGPHHQRQVNRAHCCEAAHDGFCFLSGAY